MTHFSLKRPALLAVAGLLALVPVTGLLAQGGIDPASLAGLVQDEAAAKVEGTWTKSVHTKPFLGEGYQYASGGEGQRVTFTLNVEREGDYQILLSYTPGPNRTEKATVLIEAADGEKLVSVNQMRQPEGPYSFQPLGEFPLTAGPVKIVVSAEGNKKGVVIADGVQILTPDQFKIAQAEAPQKPPKLLATLNTNPNKPAKPAAKPEEKKPEEPAEIAPPFVRKPATRPLAKITSDKLDALMEQYVGGIENSIPIDDEAYVRRVTLDLIGRQPTLDEREAFLADADADKRARLVERLLASPEFGVNWANYYSDVISYRTPEPELTFLNYTPFKVWLAEQFNANKGWDETTYTIVTATGKVADNPAATYVGFHQADKSRLASETTRVFLATQIQCAECHDHKFIDMPQATFHHVAAFFVRVQAKLPWNDSSQIVVSSKPTGEHKMEGRKEEMKPIAFSERSVDLGISDLKRRAELAEWIIGAENPWFAKAFTNRVWARTMGRGFCEPVDEIGELGDRVLPEVHAALAEHFAATEFDVKDVFRVVALSKTYQREIRDADKGVEKPFAAIAAGRLRGDEVFDALATGIKLPNVTPPATPASAAIRFPPPPKSTRDLVNEAFGFDPSAEQSNVARTMQQAMLLMNNKQIQAQINAQPGADTMLAKLVAAEKDDDAAITRLYQQVLARKPATSEIALAKEHIASVGQREAGYEDLLWGLVNSAEFLSRR